MGHGNCFEVAARIVSGLGVDQSDPTEIDDVQRGLDYIATVGMMPSQEVKEVTLVHGVVERSSDKLLHLHGWVEVRMAGGIFGEERIMCLDTANGREFWMPQDAYYRAGVCLTTSYTPQRTMEMLAEHKTWGPWELNEPDQANQRLKELRAND